MAYTKICVAAALQRYLDITPIPARIRDLAGVLAAAHNAPVSVLTVEAPVELLPGVETMEEKIEALYKPLKAEGLEVKTLRSARANQAARSSPTWRRLVRALVQLRQPLEEGGRSTSVSAAPAAALLRDLGSDGDHRAAERGGAGEGAVR